MRKQLKRLVAALVIAFGAICSNAATPIYNVLCINRTDGEVERLQLHADLRVGLSPEGHILLTHPEVIVEIPRDEVKDFTVVEDSHFTSVYDGNHSGIDQVTAPAANISISSTAISATGVDGIAFYDLKGTQVTFAAAANGTATLAISSLAKGVYIVKAGKTTLKVTL